MRILYKHNLSVKLLIFSCSSDLTYNFVLIKNRLNVTVLLSTHIICFVEK